MTAIQAFTKHIRERLRAAGFPSFVAGSEDLANEPPPQQMHGVWVMHPIGLKVGAYDLTEAKRRQTFALVGLWSGVGTEITGKASRGAMAVVDKILNSEYPPQVTEITFPYEEWPIDTTEGRTEIGIRIFATLKD
jgi:hypothetical protein